LSAINKHGSFIGRFLPEARSAQEFYPMSALRTLALAAALSVGFAGVAFARDAVFTATLATPAQQTQVIAQNAIWNCEGATCVARVNHGASVRACRQLAREVGVRITGYGPSDRPLSVDEIARCNGEATQTQEASN
jgi:hypothetical protein